MEPMDAERHEDDHLTSTEIMTMAGALALIATLLLFVIAAV